MDTPEWLDPPQKESINDAQVYKKRMDEFKDAWKMPVNFNRNFYFSVYFKLPVRRL